MSQFFPKNGSKNLEILTPQTHQVVTYINRNYESVQCLSRIESYFDKNVYVCFTTRTLSHDQVVLTLTQLEIINHTQRDGALSCK